MINKDIDKLKKDYLDTPIPLELDSVVKKALLEGQRKQIKNNNKLRKPLIAAASMAACILLLAVSVNTMPVFADALSKVPVVGSIIEVLTLKQFTLKEDTYNANIEVPAIQGLNNKELQNSLNDKYLEENKKLYEDFIKEVEDIKAIGGAHMGVDSGYVVKTDNDKILSIGRYVVNMAGSSSTVFKYDTIDKKQEILITLPSLFQDDSYINKISENIKEQMAQQMKDDPNKLYWIEDAFAVNFEKINGRQSFYINQEGKLVISFDKYEVAPGYMGVVEFVIPTEAISDALVGNEYIK